MRTCFEILSKACWYMASLPDVTAPLGVWVAVQLVWSDPARSAVPARGDLPDGGQGSGSPIRGTVEWLLGETAVSLRSALACRQRYISSDTTLVGTRKLDTDCLELRVRKCLQFTLWDTIYPIEYSDRWKEEIAKKEGRSTG